MLGQICTADYLEAHGPSPVLLGGLATLPILDIAYARRVTEKLSKVFNLVISNY